MLVLTRLNKKDGTFLGEKRKVDDLFSEYDIKLRNWILEEFKDDLTLYNYLTSPVTELENHPASMEKYVAESISNIRRFVRALWPRKIKKGRMVQVGSGWLNSKDKEKMFRHKVMSTKKEIDYFYKNFFGSHTL